MSIDAMKQALEYTRPGAIVPVTPETVKILVDALRLAIEQAERQEPVAWWNGEYGSPVFGLKRDTPGIGLGNPDATPLYTTPPQRQPLTEEELKKLWYGTERIMGWYSFEEIARAIERAHGIGGGE